MNHYTATYNSPLGSIVIESNGETLTGLRFGEGELGSTQEAASIPIFYEVRRWLDDYFAGKQTENAVMLKKDALNQKNAARIIVQPKGTAFQQRIWQALLTIPYGETVSYGEIARMVGCKSAQAVGQAVGRNPIALIIPCHRVIAANGQLGGYAYGTEIKKRLLEVEKHPTETSVIVTRW